MSEPNNEQSSLSVNLRLTETITEKVVMVFLSAFISFGSGFAYANYTSPNPAVPASKCTVNDTGSAVK